MNVPLGLQLKRGEAEIFGAELGLGESVVVKGDKVAVCGWRFHYHMGINWM